MDVQDLKLEFKVSLKMLLEIQIEDIQFKQSLSSFS